MKEIVKNFFECEGVRRSQDENGNIQFAAMDVAGKLGYSEDSNVQRLVAPEERSTIPFYSEEEGRTRNLAVINQQGLYRVILSCRSKEAQPFQAELLASMTSLVEVSRFTDPCENSANVVLDIAGEKANLLYMGLRGEDVDNWHPSKWSLYLMERCGRVVESVKAAPAVQRKEVERLAASCHLWLERME